MSKRGTSFTLQQTDYDAIENTIMETVQGRQFLAEFARRTSAIETDRSIKEMARLHTAATNVCTNEKLQNIWHDLAAILQIITAARHELITRKHENCRDNSFAQVTSAPNTIIAKKEQAENTIFNIVRNIKNTIASIHQEKNQSTYNILDTQIDNLSAAVFASKSILQYNKSREIKILNLIEAKIDAIVSVIRVDIHKYVDTKPGKVVSSADSTKCQQTKIDNKQNKTLLHTTADTICDESVRLIQKLSKKNHKASHATTSGWEELIEQYGQPETKQTREMNTGHDKKHPAINRGDLGTTESMLKSDLSAIHSQHTLAKRSNLMTSDIFSKKLHNLAEA